MILENSFTVDATATGALATATKAATTGKRYVITGAHASYNDAFIGEVAIKVGAVVKATFHVHSQRDIKGLQIEAASSEDVSAELLTGTPTTGVGRVTLTGFAIKG